MGARFRLWHLFLLTASFAVVLGIGSRSPVAGAFACPLIIGGMVGAWRSNSWSGAVPGLLAAYFWSLVFLVVGIASGLGSAMLVLVFLTSIAGGYVGGMVELDARGARD